MPGTKTRAGAQEYAAGAIIAGKYRLLHRLGQGGMGSIWAAHNPTLDINLALKLIRLDTASDDAHARLIQEARATARLADPGIVRIFDVGHTEQGDPFITMELLTGTNLRQALDGGPLDPVRAVRTLLPIMRALECAHRGGIVHRDVKPDNIVLSIGTRGDLQPKLVDFGVAKILTRPNQLTSVGAAVGSPLYMSPEQARGERIDARTDLWSICVVLYESIMGTPPFDASNSNALLHAIATQSAPTLVGRGVCDEALSRIIDRGLSKKREERWQNARGLMLALAEWLRERGVADDITGLSLRGRSVGSPSSLPGPAPPSGRDAGDKGAAATVKNVLDEAAASSVAPERRISAILWGALAFIGLALMVMAIVAARRGASPAEDRPADARATADHPASEGPAADGPAPDRAVVTPFVSPVPTLTPTPASSAGGSSVDPARALPAREADALPSSAPSPLPPAGPKTAPSAQRARTQPARLPHAREKAKATRVESSEPRPELTPKPTRAPAPFKNPFE